LDFAGRDTMILPEQFSSRSDREGSTITVIQGADSATKGLRDALDRMKPLFTDKSPFKNPSRIPEKIQWVKPKLVCEISFAKWTRGGELRQTVFLGWRDDKKAKDVVLER
jgi:bifunctional non-homologous end joining protein LigD